jgi:hypothetical protein
MKRNRLVDIIALGLFFAFGAIMSAAAALKMARAPFRSA